MSIRNTRSFKRIDFSWGILLRAAITVREISDFIYSLGNFHTGTPSQTVLSK